MANRALTLVAIPTVNGNGFVAGQRYVFRHVRNGLYETSIGEHTKYASFPASEKSAHLWDGRDWDNAGHFNVIEEN